MSFEHPQMSAHEQSPAQSEKQEGLLDISDPQLQGCLIERFFTKKYPEMPLSDPSTRKLAMQEWIGDVNNKNTPAAHFRAYVELIEKEHQNGYKINSTDSVELDRILDELHSVPEALH